MGTSGQIRRGPAGSAAQPGPGARPGQPRKRVLKVATHARGFSEKPSSFPSGRVPDIGLMCVRPPPPLPLPHPGEGSAEPALSAQLRLNLRP